MSSNLTGTFIANTYQKLLQVDTDNGSVGSTAPFSATNAKTTSKHNILNGLGQSVGGLVIDQTGVSGFNGGLYLKNTTSGAIVTGKLRDWETLGNFVTGKHRDWETS